MQILQSEHARALNRLAVGPGGLIVAASGPPASAPGVEAWDAVTGAHRWTVLATRANIRHVAFALGGGHLFVADSGTQRLFAVPADGDPPTEVARTGWAFAGVAVAGDRAFVASDGDRPVLRCMSFPSFGDLWRRDAADTFSTARVEFGPSVAITPDGNRFALFVREGGRGAQRAVTVHTAATGARQTAIPFNHAWDVRKLAFAADGHKLLAQTGEHTIEVFDALTGAQTGRLAYPEGVPVAALAVHPHGPVACARGDGTVTFWDADTCEPIRTFDWRAGALVSLAFGADGALGAAGTRDGKIVVWDVDL